MRLASVEITGLHVAAFDESIADYVQLVRSLDLQIRSGEVLGITGESGSGKTTIGLALGGMLPSNMEARVDRMTLGWRDQKGKAFSPTTCEGSIQTELSRLRGDGIFTLFQEPRASLNPYRRIGWQLDRCIRQSRSTKTVSKALEDIGLAGEIADRYPQELSTGMCQRVFLAMSGVLGASLFIADEPFASLDPASRDQLAGILKAWVNDNQCMMVLISHDLKLLAELANNVLVLLDGEVAEEGPAPRVLGEGPAHPYTQQLIQSHLAQTSTHSDAVACCFARRCAGADPDLCVEQVPAAQTAGERHWLRCSRWPNYALGEVKIDSADLAPTGEPILETMAVGKSFTPRRGNQVFSNLSFSVLENDRLGIMGPSGQGKTTLARILLGLTDATSGTARIKLDDQWLDLLSLGTRKPATLRKMIQLVYQDADLAIDPAGRIGSELLAAHRIAFPEAIGRSFWPVATRTLNQLGLSVNILEALPYRLSGGERKRVAIARSLLALGHPYRNSAEAPWRILVLDEPTSGLDLLSQARLSDLLLGIQRPLRLSYIVISHDRGFVDRFCSRVMQFEPDPS